MNPNFLLWPDPADEENTMNSKEDIRRSVTSYVLEEFLLGENPDSIGETTPLLSTGILDSISTMKLVSFLEDTYHIEFKPHEISANCLEDIARITKTVAEKGNANSISDAGVSALMLHAAAESAALNVKINLTGITDIDFVGWKTEEVSSILRTSKIVSDEILAMVHSKVNG